MKRATTGQEIGNPFRQASASRLRAMVLGVVLAGVSFASAASAAPTVQIIIENFAFSPANVTVPKGATVEWVNRDPTPHNVVADKPQFDSGLLGVDDTFDFKFSEPGIVAFSCGQHAHMSGTVTVTDK